jgi:hypothetical protein
MPTHVVVIEDESPIAQLGRRFLSDEGTRVSSADLRAIARQALAGG